MGHPFGEIPEWMNLPLLLLLLILMGGLMLVLGRTLRGEDYSIVDLELAGEVDQAQQIINSWDASGARGRALFNVRLDFVFLVVYSTTIALGCVPASEVFRTLALWVAVLGVALAWAQLLAALLDAVENVALLKMLRDSLVRDPWPRISRWSALPKFAIAGAGSLYVLVGACICLAPTSM